jgi:uncharacterized Ntn-hydrolase superfamily protein
VTYSICVRERDAGRLRFGVAAATRLPAVGSLCPHVGDRGAAAVQGVTDPDAGPRCLAALDDGDDIDGAVESALAVAGARERRQIHGVDAEGTAAYTGDACPGWAGHAAGADGGHVVAGTALVGSSVLEAMERAYVEGEREAPLGRRLIAALAAGERAGGDCRDFPAGSAAVVVDGPERSRRLYDDLRVDASETPVADLRETYRLARRGHEAAIETYGGQTEN